jgi:hypothetical protein
LGVIKLRAGLLHQLFAVRNEKAPQLFHDFEKLPPCLFNNDFAKQYAKRTNVPT